MHIHTHTYAHMYLCECVIVLAQSILGKTLVSVRILKNRKFQSSYKKHRLSCYMVY